MAADPFEHVTDSHHFHALPSLGWEYEIPKVNDFQLTKFMVLQVVAALIVLICYVPLAIKARNGEPVRGWFWNMLESVLTFIRERVAKQNIGKHADHYVPFLWTLFLYILVNNLLGMIPFLGSPTASLAVTGTLALITLIAIHGGIMLLFGVPAYFKAHVLQVDAPLPIAIFVKVLFFLLEMLGHLIKAFVLSVRLFANMFAGHMVLAVILGFIVMAKEVHYFLFWPITAASVLGVTALSCLELFVAFLQAFVFTFLASLFIGSVLHHAEHAAHGHDDHGHDHGTDHSHAHGGPGDNHHGHGVAHGH